VRFKALHAEGQRMIIVRFVHLHSEVKLVIVHNLSLVHFNCFVQIPEKLVNANLSSELCDEN